MQKQFFLDGALPKALKEGLVIWNTFTWVLSGREVTTEDTAVLKLSFMLWFVTLNFRAAECLVDQPTNLDCLLPLFLVNKANFRSGLMSKLHNPASTIVFSRILRYALHFGHLLWSSDFPEPTEQLWRGLVYLSPWSQYLDGQTSASISGTSLVWCLLVVLITE